MICFELALPHLSPSFPTPTLSPPTTYLTLTLHISSSRKNARRIRRPALVELFFVRRTFEQQRRSAAVVEQGPRVVLTRAGPRREDSAAGPHRRRESRVVGVDDKRGNSNAAKTRDDKRRVGEPAGDGIATTGNATDDARVGRQRSPG